LDTKQELEKFGINLGFPLENLSLERICALDNKLGFGSFLGMLKLGFVSS